MQFICSKERARTVALPPRRTAPSSVVRRAGERQRGNPIRTGSTLRAVALLGFVLLVAWTYAFLGVHELKHIGQADASACKFTLIASTLGGSESPTIPALPAPPVLGFQFSPPAPAGELSGEAVPQQARAPPALA